MRILIVENNRIDLRAIKMVLDPLHPTRTDMCATVEEAVHYLREDIRQRRRRIVILDMHLSAGGYGADVLEFLHKQLNPSSVRVFVLTSEEGGIPEEIQNRACVHGYIRKQDLSPDAGEIKAFVEDAWLSLTGWEDQWIW